MRPIPRRSWRRGAAVVETITSEGGKACFAVADLSEPAQLADLALQAGAVNILVTDDAEGIAVIVLFSTRRMRRGSTRISPVG